MDVFNRVAVIKRRSSGVLEVWKSKATAIRATAYTRTAHTELLRIIVAADPNYSVYTFESNEQAFDTARLTDCLPRYLVSVKDC